MTVSETSNVFLTWREGDEKELTRVDLTEAALEWPLSKVNISEAYTEGGTRGFPQTSPVNTFRARLDFSELLVILFIDSGDL